MVKRKGLLLGALGVTVCWISLAFSMPQVGHTNVPPAPPDKDVHVSNTPADPVPVQVTGTPNVVIANGRQAWHNEWGFQMFDGDPAQFQAIVIPAGKRLVIEHVTASLDADNGLLPDVTIFSNNPSQPALLLRQHLVLTNVGQVSGRSRWQASQAMRSYVDSGSILVHRSPPNGAVNGNVTVVGYLIDP